MIIKTQEGSKKHRRKKEIMNRDNREQLQIWYILIKLYQ